MKPKVLLDPSFRTMNQLFAPADLARLHDIADVIWAKDEPMPADEVAKVKGELFAILTGRWRHGSVNDAPKLRAIMELGGSHPMPKDLDYEACFSRGIRVLSCAPAFGPAVAEMALAMTLAAKRQLIDSHNDFVAGKERYLEAGTVGSTMLFDQTVGFIGFGGLAKNLRPLLAPFRCKIQVYDPWLPAHFLERQGVKSVGLEELLTTSKVIYVLAIPAATNRALLDRAMLELIQADSLLVLISRAHLVDFDALTELLHARRFRAAIDVFPQEPLARDHAIRSAPGVLLSAHLAGGLAEAELDIGRMAVDDLTSMIAGLPPTEMQVAQPEIVRLRGTV